MSRSLLTISLESNIDGKTAKELEYTFYGKLKDLSELNKAPGKEEHEQWKIPLDTDKAVKARLRMIDGRRFTMATKVKQQGQLGSAETEMDITEDMYKSLRLIAVDGYKKTRYEIPVAGTGLKWEIDVFLDHTGKQHPWVKIDLEVTSPDDKIPMFPLELEDLILQNGPRFTPEQERFVRRLWDVEWSRLDDVSVTSE